MQAHELSRRRLFFLERGCMPVFHQARSTIDLTFASAPAASHRQPHRQLRPTPRAINCAAQRNVFVSVEHPADGQLMARHLELDAHHTIVAMLAPDQTGTASSALLFGTAYAS
ncbi:MULTISPECIES: hypothetical protein [unclassified Variovorax]|uniref:hypothetical protein n=1 Tax=unclassified Variovorax TaxID=663243 RepID=UPI003ED0BABF